MEPGSRLDLSPASLIQSARAAHPAFKYAIVVAGLAAIVAVVFQFGMAPATLVFGIIVLVILMVVFFVFAQAVTLAKAKLALPALVLTWAFLLLGVGTGVFVFSSAFFDLPLPLKTLILRSTTKQPSDHSPPPATSTAPPRPLSDVSGHWVIEATEKMPKTYLHLHLREGTLSGHTTMLFSTQAKLVIFDGHVVGDRVAFKTKRQLRYGQGAASTITDLVYQYEGRLDGTTLRFAVQVQEGSTFLSYEDVPAERVSEKLSAVELVATLEGHTGSVHRLVSLPDGRLASASSDRTVKIWNLSTRQAEASFVHHDSKVETLVPLPEARLVSAEYDGTLRMWDLHTGKELFAFEEREGLIGAVVLLNDGRLAGGWSTGELTLWNRVTGRIEKTLKIDDRWIGNMAVLSDGRLVTGDQDGTIRLWNLASGQPEVLVRQGKPGSSDGVTGLEALTDGRLAYSTGAGKEVTIWNPASGQPEMVLPFRGRYVETWRLPGRLLAVGADGRLTIWHSNEEITLWDPVTGKSEVVLNVEDKQWYTLRQLPDGRFAIGTATGPIMLWKWR